VQAIDRAPPPQDLIADFPVKKIHPVTLPVNEALESSLLTLSSLIADKRNLAQLVSSLHFTLEDSSLILHPFRASASQLVHTKAGLQYGYKRIEYGKRICNRKNIYSHPIFYNQGLS